MQLDQILIRPSDSVVILQYTDSAGRSGSATSDLRSNATASKLVDDSKKLLPAEDSNRPDAPAIEAEISQLEDRVAQLRASIGQ